MKLSYVLSLAAFCLLPTNGSPIPSNETDVDLMIEALVRRQSKARKCGPHTYTVDDQKDGYNNAKSHEGNPATADNGIMYPHNFYNNEGIDFDDCPGRKPPFREFPILRDGLLFRDGLDQGLDRVIYKKFNSKKYEFCGLITHDGATGNAFKKCN